MNILRYFSLVSLLLVFTITTSCTSSISEEGHKFLSYEVNNPDQFENYFLDFPAKYVADLSREKRISFIKTVSQDSTSRYQPNKGLINFYADSDDDGLGSTPSFLVKSFSIGDRRKLYLIHFRQPLSKNTSPSKNDTFILEKNSDDGVWRDVSEVFSKESEYYNWAYFWDEEKQHIYAHEYVYDDKKLSRWTYDDKYKRVLSVNSHGLITLKSNFHDKKHGPHQPRPR